MEVNCKKRTETAIEVESVRHKVFFKNKIVPKTDDCGQVKNICMMESR